MANSKESLKFFKKNDNTIQKIIVNDDCISDPKKMANQFNIFFSNIAKEVVNKIEPVNQLPPDLNYLDVNNPVFSFSAEPVTCSEIIEATEALQCKCSEDFMGLSTKLVKKIIFSLSNPLKHIRYLICLLRKVKFLPR
jgi:hypothetical protein